MPIQDVTSIGQQQAPSEATELRKDVLEVAPVREQLQGALATSAVLVVLWAGFHWDDPASWMVGIPSALIGGALTLFLPSSSPLRLSPLGGLRFAKFVFVGILRGAIDVSRSSLSPQTLQPGYMPWHTNLPEGRPRRLLAVAITLLPGTLTARIEGDMLTVHALDLSDATRAELAALEAHIAKLFKLDHKGTVT
jgi:multicomponent Na+:H+ antiporter subunit E